jgi:hypothetical protein
MVYSINGTSYRISTLFRGFLVVEFIISGNWGVIETSAAAAKATASSSAESTTAAESTAAASAETAAATETTIILERSSWSTLHKGPHWSSDLFRLQASTLVGVGSELDRFTFLNMVE